MSSSTKQKVQWANVQDDYAAQVIPGTSRHVIGLLSIPVASCEIRQNQNVHFAVVACDTKKSLFCHSFRRPTSTKQRKDCRKKIMFHHSFECRGNLHFTTVFGHSTNTKSERVCNSSQSLFLESLAVLHSSDHELSWLDIALMCFVFFWLQRCLGKIAWMYFVLTSHCKLTLSPSSFYVVEQN